MTSYLKKGLRRLSGNTGKEQTITGTDISEVKRLNQQSGLTYNEVKALLQKHYKKQK